MKDLSKKSLSEVEVQDNVAGYYVEKRYKKLGLKYHSSVIKRMMEGIHGSILDVGCGTGIIHDLYPELDIMGIDISSGMLAHHKGKHKIGSAEKLDFPDSSFDSVICRSVLHHLPDCHTALREIRRVLRPNGKFVCWETNKSWLAERIRERTQHGDHFSDYHHSFDNLPSIINYHFGEQNTRVTYQGYVAYPLLGFPDIIDFSRFVEPVCDHLIALDEFLSRVPIINKMGFAVMIEGWK